MVFCLVFSDCYANLRGCLVWHSLTFKSWFRSKLWFVTTVLFSKHAVFNHNLKEFQTMVGSLGIFIFLNSFSQACFYFFLSLKFCKILNYLASQILKPWFVILAQLRFYDTTMVCNYQIFKSRYTKQPLSCNIAASV